MPRDASDTRERILDAAQRVVMQRGFAATSVDAIQEEAGISRGTFFYHFPSKDDLARTLLRRYARADRDLTADLMARAERLANDPLQQVLIFLALHEELFEGAEGWDPGCLFASYSYEAGLFDPETHAVIEEAIGEFRDTLGSKLQEAFGRHPPVTPADPFVLADLAYGVMQGGFVLARVRGEARVVAEHLRHLRTYLELLCGVAEGVSDPA